MPRMKLEKRRLGGPITWMSRSRASISSQRIFNCRSASRSPTQRWMPAPHERCWRGFVRSTIKASAFSITLSSRLDDLVALPDALACKLCVSSSRSAHVDDWCLVANSLGDEAWHERGIGLEFGELAWILGQRQEAAQHRVPRRVVSADDE